MHVLSKDTVEREVYEREVESGEILKGVEARENNLWSVKVVVTRRWKEANEVKITTNRTFSLFIFILF